MTPNLTTSSNASLVRRIGLALFIAAALALLGGCAVGKNPRDPLEPFNRRMMEFNEGVDAVALKPVATLYREAVPPLVRTGVSNFFGNMSDAWSFVNSALQLKLQNAAENAMRVSVNTVFGLGGILDIASEMNIERHREDFGQTLGRWGVPAGPYLVLPLLGPSTLRDALAMPIDRKGDPLHDVDSWGSQGALYALRLVDVRSNLLRASSVLDEAALDKYSFTRDAHLQRRRAAIFENRSSEAEGREPSADGALPASDGAVPPEPPPEAPPASAPAR